MTIIGEFKATKEGFEGHIRTFCLDVDIVIITVLDGRGGHYTVHRGRGQYGPRIGHGEQREDGTLGSRIVLVIDDPSFAAPLHAELYASLLYEGRHDLFWKQPAERRQLS